MSEWQPIETAPKDARPMLLFYKSLGIVYGHYDKVGTADWWITQVRPEEQRTMDWTQWYIDKGRGEDPTHWMPLPSPPVHNR